MQTTTPEHLNIHDRKEEAPSSYDASRETAERERTEEALRQAIEELRIVTQSMAVPVTRCSRDLKYVWVSKPYADWIDRPGDEIVGRPIKEIIGADAFEQLHPYFERVLNGETVRYEEQVSFRGIGPRWINAIYTPTMDARGERDGWVAVIIDIDERKQAEALASRSRTMLLELVERAPFGIYIVDSEFRIAQMNLGSQNGAFRNVRPVIGRDFAEVMHILWPEEVAAQIIRAFRHTLDTGEAYYSPRFINPRHDIEVTEAYEWELHRMTLPDGQYGVVCYYFDSTKLRETEAALRASEKRLASELEATSRLHDVSGRLLSATDLATALGDVLENAIRTCGADFGNIQLLNPQTEALEILVHRGFGQDFLDYFREVRVEEASACAQAMKSGRRIIIEDVLLDPDFEPLRKVASAAGYRAVQSTPLKTHDGVILGMLSTHFRRPHTIAERDERLLDLYARHAADLIERLRYEQALVEADRLKDEFLANASHELRTPLTAIVGWTKMLRAGQLDEATKERALETIERNAHVQTKLVEDLLDISRIITGKLVLDTQPIEVVPVVMNAINTVRPAAEAKNIQVETGVDAEAGYVLADANRLQQVVWNLLSNAVKFTPSEGRVQVYVRRVDSQIEISVSDTGEGIEPGFLPHVFDRFRQADGSKTRKQGGLGLGLAIVRNLVELHGGTVRAGSEGRGRGATFVVRLPVLGSHNAGETAAIASMSKEQGSDGHDLMEWPLELCGVRVLLVDDDRDTVEMLRLALSRCEAEVVTASSAAEALREVERRRPDVLVSDIGMPEMDGYELMRKIRAMESGGDGTHLPALALTAYAKAEDRASALAAGFQMHLPKPIEPAEFSRAIASLVKRR